MLDVPSGWRPSLLLSPPASARVSWARWEGLTLSVCRLTAVCLAQGTGVYYYDSGDKYEGEWMRNKKHGRGTMEYANGNIYEGDWEDDKRCGIGVLLLANGDRFEGSFYNDVKEGPGRFFYLSTKKLYEGEWANDTAKCGVYRDLPPEFEGDQPEPAQYHIGLPVSRLVDAERVLDDAVSRVEGKRDLPDNASPDQSFSETQFLQLQELFSEVDSSGEGYLDYASMQLALRRLGLDAPVAELQEFLAGPAAEGEGQGGQVGRDGAGRAEREGGNRVSRSAVCAAGTAAKGGAVAARSFVWRPCDARWTAAVALTVPCRGCLQAWA